MYAILHTDIEPLSSVRSSVSEELSKVVEKALAKDVADRYSQIDELLTDLQSTRGLSRTILSKSIERDRHAVGRDKELKVLDETLNQVLSGSARLITVVGEAGIGKTTVVEEYLTRVAKSGIPVRIVNGQCSERLAGTEAYLPFFDVMAHLLQSDQDGSIIKLMREKAPWWYVQVASLSPDDPSNHRILEQARHTTQEQLKRELAIFLQDASRKTPLIIFIEDLHWADVSTTDMIAFLGGRFDDLRVLFIGTYRPVEMQLMDHPFLQIKPDLVSRGQCREVALDFLTMDNIAEYLALEYSDNSFPSELAEQIHKKTEGSPLFMADLISDLHDRGVIVKAGERWELSDSFDNIQLELPDSVMAMIERKIGRLGDADKRLMEVASIQGYEFDSAVLATVLEQDEEDVEERLQKLERDYRFVETSGEDEFPDRTMTIKYRFVHVLYQNELFNALTRTKRVRISRAVAETIEKFHSDKLSLVASGLARLFETARLFEKAVTYYGLAAEHAEGVFAFNESVTLVRRGLELLKSLPESKERDRKEIELYVRLGSSLTSIRGYSDQEVVDTYIHIQDLTEKVDAGLNVDLSLWGLHSYYLTQMEMEQAVDLCTKFIEKGAAYQGADATFCVEWTFGCNL